ncbi:MAG: XdhC family protein [Hyphomicrobium sp.]|uniref:XdhC family protein n=1 Tax=Hyphomicrobium sp. CS1BSMeth3 TaxID=1892844 RepID=UPI0009301EBE|nr:XdhC family protein [Hyphomicrobium sp. CS1BSMeth3]MBN9262337.1 XdhC family protein [Hyphomicrobium sp.]
MTELQPRIPNAATIDVLGAARDWLSRDGQVAIATVIDTWGSAPVPVGGQMAIAADGNFQGSVSGGCIEGDVIIEGGEALADGKPRTLTFGVADETAWRAGLPCGGQVRVLVERLDKDNGGDALLDRAIAARESRHGLVIKTKLDDASRTLYERGDANLPEDIANRFRTAKSQLIESPDGAVFVHALVPPARIIAIGATHIAQVLAQLAALSGYEIIIIDPRTAFADPARFGAPDAKLVAEWPQDALPRLGLDPYTAVLTLAHVAHIDDEALKLAVRANCLYVAALGSSRNHAKRRERLLAAGITEEEFARIKAPIGLDIGAQTPAEIAVSIMAEVILAVRGTKKAKG